MGHSNRINNTIKYRSPSFHGVTVAGMYSLGGVAGATGQKQVWALAAGYRRGPLQAGVGYLNAKNPNLSVFGGNGNAGPATTDNMGSVGSATGAESNPVYSGFASANSMELVVAGAKYHFGAGDVGATFSHAGYHNLGDLASGPNPLHYAGNAVLNNGEINAGYNLSPTIRVSAAYDYTRKASVGAYGGATYQQGTLAADYKFSKRTRVYLLAIYQHASGTDSLGQSAVASITQLTPSATGNQTLVRLGLVQTF
jgi:predicted porin